MKLKFYTQTQRIVLFLSGDPHSRTLWEGCVLVTVCVGRIVGWRYGVGVFVGWVGLRLCVWGVGVCGGVGCLCVLVTLTHKSPLGIALFYYFQILSSIPLILHTQLSTFHVQDRGYRFKGCSRGYIRKINYL